MSSTKTLEIQHALSAYCHYVDNGSLSAIADLFAEDAVLMPYYDGQYDVRGKQEIHRWYQFYLDKMKASVKNLRHSISTALVEEEGTTVTSHCHLTAIFTIIDNNKTYQGHERQQQSYWQQREDEQLSETTGNSSRDERTPSSTLPTTT